MYVNKMSIEIYPTEHSTQGMYMSTMDDSLWFLAHARVPPSVAYRNNAVFVRSATYPHMRVVADVTNPSFGTADFTLTIRGTPHVLVRI